MYYHYSNFRSHDFHYLSLRLWIGLFVAAILMVLVALDASALVCYITRFTEENFATLISVIFIYKAFENVRNNYLSKIELNISFISYSYFK